MYCWGRVSDGQLGLGGIQETIIRSPSWNKHVADKTIRHVACGLKHTLLLTESGVVHSCGSNEKGQLGQDETSTRPAPIISLESKKITQVSCGHAHSIAVDDEGNAYTWGGNQYGQLGYGDKETPPEVSFVPKKMAVFTGKPVAQVACGANHTLALLKDGRLYTWGENSDGQLGHNLDKSHVGTPRIVASIKDLPMIKIAAGKAHNLVLSMAGGVFAWGRNNFGQLGMEISAGLGQPAEVRRLRYEKAKFISCGEEHTAVLTYDGSVFTFGSNSYGQLGHNNTQNVSMPTKVWSLVGKEVLQVACGRMHTLVVVKDSFEVLSFGLGANGQLGRDSTSNSLQPDPIKGGYWTAPVSDDTDMKTMLDTYIARENSVDGGQVLKGVYAGGDQSFATVVVNYIQEIMDSSSPLEYPQRPSTPMTPTCDTFPLRDDRRIHFSQLPYSLSGDLINSWLDDDNFATTDIEKVYRILNIVFSSPACLNASFLRPLRDRCTNQEKSGVDLLGYLRAYSLIHDKVMEPHIEDTHDDPMERWLVSGALRGLPSCPISLECCNMYYLIPLCLTKPARKPLMLAYMTTFLKMDNDTRNTLGNWFFNSSKDYIEMMIIMIKRYVVSDIIEHAKARIAIFLLSRSQSPLAPRLRLYSVEDEDNLLTVLEFFKIFYTWNLMRNEPLSYKGFHFESLNEITNFLYDYLNLVEAIQSNDRVVYCRYPFVLDENCKSRLLEVECRIQQNIAVLAQGQLFDDIMTEERVSFVLTVSRANLLNGTLTNLVSVDDSELKKPLRVIFADEEGQDDGGIRKEFFMLIFNQILNPDFGMFVEDEESHLIWFRENELFYENAEYYILIGMLCGLAMYNQVLVDLPFPLLLYKKLLGRPTSIDELLELRPSLAQNFIDMVRYEGDDFDHVYDLTFTLTHVSFGETKTVELIPNGSNIKVTKARSQEYVQAYMRYTYHDSVRNQFLAFQQGFMKVCNGRVIDMLHPCELQALIVGHRVTDWTQLEEYMLYANGYSRDHPTIKYFWESFQEFPDDAKRKFLVFFTGSDRIPLAGVQAMRMTIQKMDGGPGCAKLPVAHTCFNVLDLPPYKTKDETKQKLLQAIHFTSGFGLI